MVFLTNNLAWSGGSVADLYRCRWQIEVFFKQIKQTLQLADFLGHNANAVKWQVWMALLVYVLLRFQAWRSHWAHSFSRLLTVLRAALWLPREVGELLWDSRWGLPPAGVATPGGPAGLRGLSHGTASVNRHDEVHFQLEKSCIAFRSLRAVLPRKKPYCPSCAHAMGSL